VKTVELGAVATIDRQGVDPSSLAPETLYLGLEHIERGGRIIGHGTVAGAELASTKFRFSPAHVLFGKLRPNLGKVSRPEFEGVCSTDILPVRPSKDLDRDYLAHYLAQPTMVDFAASRTSGANLPRLSPTELAKFPIPLPPLDEQRRIAAILDHADALRAKRRQVLDHLDTLTQAIFHHTFAGDRWPEVPLASAVREGSIVTYGIVQAGEEFVGGVPYIRTGDIVGGRIVMSGLRRTDPEIAARFERSTVQTEDIVMSIRATVGTTARVPREINGANLTQGTARIAPSERVTGPYLLAFLRSEPAQRWIQAQVKGATFREITLGRLRELVVPLPPRDLQDEFARRTDAVDVQHAVVLAAQSAHDELFASLQTRAFRGEL